MWILLFPRAPYRSETHLDSYRVKMDALSMGLKRPELEAGHLICLVNLLCLCGALLPLRSMLHMRTTRVSSSYTRDVTKWGYEATSGRE
jgi:hypothetical protein